MKFATLLLAGALSVPASAQPGTPAPEPGAAPTAEHSGGHEGEAQHGPSEIWKWANFLLLAGLIGYFVGKNAGPFFAARSRQIRKDMIEAEDLRKEAEARAAAVDRRLADLGSEIEALRQEACDEQAAEEERIRRQTASEIGKLRQHAEQEIEAAGKAARSQLKRHAAQLAVALAERRIRDGMNPQVQDSLVRGFARDLTGPRHP